MRREPTARVFIWMKGPVLIESATRAAPPLLVYSKNGRVIPQESAVCEIIFAVATAAAAVAVAAVGT